MKTIALNPPHIFIWKLFLVSFATVPTADAFFLKWPFPFFFPGTATTASAAGTINYGFLRPAIIVPVTTTTAATTTTTTTPAPQIFINVPLGGQFAANRPLITQPIFGGGVAAGAFPGAIGGIASPIGAGNISGITGGGFVLPSGFPAAGGIAASGVIPGLFPGILGRSASPKNAKQASTGRIVFASRKKK